MFNRSIQMKLVKTPKNNKTEATTEPTETVDYVQIVRDTTVEVAKVVAVGIAVYVVLDTLRQIAINVAPKN